MFIIPGGGGGQGFPTLLPDWVSGFRPGVRHLGPVWFDQASCRVRPGAGL